MARVTRQQEEIAAEDIQRGDKVLHETENSSIFRLVQAVVIADWVSVQLQGIAGEVQMDPAQMVSVLVREPKCLCGCQQRTKGGEFMPGHDARMPGRFANLWEKFELAETGGQGFEITDEDRQSAIALVKRHRRGVDSGRLAKRIEAEYDPDRSCSSECQWAMGHTCVCSCGGANHRIGWMDFAARGGQFMTMFGVTAITGLPTIPKYCPGSGVRIEIQPQTTTEDADKGECPVCEKMVMLIWSDKIKNHRPPDGMRYNREGDIVWNGKRVIV